MLNQWAIFWASFQGEWSRYLALSASAFNCLTAFEHIALTCWESLVCQYQVTQYFHTRFRRNNNFPVKVIDTDSVEMGDITISWNWLGLAYMLLDLNQWQYYRHALMLNIHLKWRMQHRPPSLHIIIKLAFCNKIGQVIDKYIEHKGI